VPSPALEIQIRSELQRRQPPAAQLHSRQRAPLCSALVFLRGPPAAPSPVGASHPLLQSSQGLSWLQQARASCSEFGESELICTFGRSNRLFPQTQAAAPTGTRRKIYRAFPRQGSAFLLLTKPEPEIARAVDLGIVWHLPSFVLCFPPLTRLQPTPGSPPRIHSEADSVRARTIVSGHHQHPARWTRGNHRSIRTRGTVHHRSVDHPFRRPRPRHPRNRPTLLRPPVHTPRCTRESRPIRRPTTLSGNILPNTAPARCLRLHIPAIRAHPPSRPGRP
jgi:hypothetical protein